MHPPGTTDHFHPEDAHQGLARIRSRHLESYQAKKWRRSDVRCTPPKTNMTLEKQPFEDVSPIENGGFPMPR